MLRRNVSSSCFSFHGVVKRTNNDVRHQYNYTYLCEWRRKSLINATGFESPSHSSNKAYICTVHNSILILYLIIFTPKIMAFRMRTFFAVACFVFFFSLNACQVIRTNNLRKKISLKSDQSVEPQSCKSNAGCTFYITSQYYTV